MDRFQLITDEAVRIARDYPEISYKNAIEKAKEIFMRKAYSKNALDGIDSWIEREIEVPDEVIEIYKIEGYEHVGTFHTVEEATEYLLSRTEHFDTKYPGDFIYKEAKE